VEEQGKYFEAISYIENKLSNPEQVAKILKDYGQILMKQHP